MLQSLAIRDMVLIKAADLEFQPGLNVLTGETGAGKSILLDCLGFVLGWRTRSSLVRKGATRGEVTAVFDFPEAHPAISVLKEAELPVGEELLLRRTIGSDGRRQAFLNDRRCSAETLRKLSTHLVELHGQRDDQSLLDPRRHCALLDAFAGAGGTLMLVKNAWRKKADAEAQLQSKQDAIELARRDEAYLRHSLGELESLAPQEGEEPALDARRRLLRNAEQVRGDIDRAVAALGPVGAESHLLDASRWLSEAATKTEGALDNVLEGVERTLTELGDTSEALRSALEILVQDSDELEAVEERLFAIRGLARKYNVSPDGLVALTLDMRKRADEITESDADLERLSQDVAAATAAYENAAEKLTKIRKDAAARLNKKMAKELPPLKLGRALFVAEVRPGTASGSGMDEVSFAAATNPGIEPGPIETVASGGELSRFLLALKVCLNSASGGATLVFDEIDRGVGGATADAVGRRLRALGATAQVLVVTHSPQVAARGAHHWRVGKNTEGQEALTQVASLDPSARVDEIGRMLAGEEITTEARAAAKALLTA